MKRLFTAIFVAGTLLAGVLPASADVDVRNIGLNRDNAGQVEAYVTVGNTWMYDQEGPITITLLAKEHGKDHSEWQTVKVWDNIDIIPTGRDITKHAYSFDTPMLTNINNDKWEFKAIAKAPHHEHHITRWFNEACDTASR